MPTHAPARLPVLKPLDAVSDFFVSLEASDVDTTPNSILLFGSEELKHCCSETEGTSDASAKVISTHCSQVS